MSNQDDELRRQVERLIIENRNSLNDPTTNEPYDVKGIADDVVALIRSRERAAQKTILQGFRRRDFVNSDFYESAVIDRLAQLQEEL